MLAVVPAFTRATRPPRHLTFDTLQSSSSYRSDPIPSTSGQHFNMAWVPNFIIQWCVEIPLVSFLVENAVRVRRGCCSRRWVVVDRDFLLRFLPHSSKESIRTWSKCVRTRRCQSLRKSVETQSCQSICSLSSRNRFFVVGYDSILSDSKRGKGSTNGCWGSGCCA